MIVNRLNIFHYREREVTERKELSDAGLKEAERLQDKVAKTSQKTELLEEIIICDVSNKICYLSMVGRALFIKCCLSSLLLCYVH